MSVARKLPEYDTSCSYCYYAKSLDLYGLLIIGFSVLCCLHDIEQLVTSEVAELVLNGGAENAGYTFNTSRRQHIRLHAPLACTLKQPHSTATDNTITCTVAVATTAGSTTTTTSLPVTSTTNRNIVYVF
jgi:hypothetical protein